MEPDAVRDGLLRGDRRAIARAVSWVEDRDPRASELLQAVHGNGQDAHIIGITGSPGTGKSTLVDRLIEHYRRADKKVGVIAVDPSSPFTGGAILGDRIRMQSRSNDDDVFIRSMSSRGHLGGLAATTGDAATVLAAAGMDVVIVETVGVGQAEVDIVRLADTVVVVLVPNLGDDVQAVKAGVMEIADVFCVNKSDLDGADKVEGEVEAMMSLGHPDEDDFWWPPIVRTVAERGEGTEGLATAIGSHVDWSRRTGHWDVRRAHRIRMQIRDLLTHAVEAFAFAPDGAPREAFASLVVDAGKGATTPREAADRILAAFRQAG